jgi:esterase/lipase superfamily enzyme/Tfp pilus assembly protein PilF
MFPLNSFSLIRFACAVLVLVTVSCQLALGDDSLRESLKEAGQLNEDGGYQKAISIIEHINVETVNDERDIAHLKTLEGELRYELGQFKAAEGILLDALTITERIYGREALEVGQPAAVLAALYNEIGDSTNALNFAQRALTIEQNHGGPKILLRTMQVGDVYLDLGRYADAQASFSLALSKTNNPTSHEAAQALSRIGLLLQEQGLFAEAEVKFKDALRIDETKSGEQHIFVAFDLHRLGRLYWAIRRDQEAESTLKRSLELKRPLGDHFVVANSLSMLGRVYKDMRRYGEAEEQHKRALKIRENIYGVGAVTTAISLYDLASLYEAWGRYQEGEELIKRAIGIFEAALGQERRLTALCSLVLAGIYEKEDNLSGAEFRYKYAASIQRKILRTHHPDLGATLSGLGGLYQSQGRYSDAEVALKEALDINEKAFGQDHPQVIANHLQLAEIYRALGKRDLSYAHFIRARDIRKTKEITIYFGTNRRLSPTVEGVTFADEPSKTTVGRATVVISKEDAKASARPSGVEKELVDANLTDTRRMLIIASDIQSEGQIIEEARREMQSAKHFPGQALLFVHGFNVDFENAVRRLGQIVYDLDFDGAAFVFSWATVSRYLQDAQVADSSSADLGAFLAQVVAKSEPLKLHVVAHSMGNAVVLGALEKAERTIRIGNVISAAPDVFARRFDQFARIMVGRGAKVTVYASANDWALLISQAISGLQRAGQFSADLPMLIAGVDVIDLTDASTGVFSLNHGVYVSNPTVVDDMRQTLEGIRPPDRRSRNLVPITYWRYNRP